MDCAVIGQRGNFAITLSIPGKLSERQSAQARRDFDMLDARFRCHLFFASPTVYDSYFLTFSGRDVHLGIVIKATKLDRTRRVRQWLLNQRVLESLRAIKY